MAAVAWDDKANADIAQEELFFEFQLVIQEGQHKLKYPNLQNYPEDFTLNLTRSHFHSFMGEVRD